MPNDDQPFSPAFGGIKVYRSRWVPKGKLIVLGTGISLPENWKSMTKDEQLGWAITRGCSIMINEREPLYAERI